VNWWGVNIYFLKEVVCGKSFELKQIIEGKRGREGLAIDTT
jgi:hypothetical protein